MLDKNGYLLVRLHEIPWEDRVNVDGWPSRGGMHCQDPDNSLTLRLIDYPLGSMEPRHVHAGTHATTVLKGRAINPAASRCRLIFLKARRCSRSRYAEARAAPQTHPF